MCRVEQGAADALKILAEPHENPDMPMLAAVARTLLRGLNVLSLVQNSLSPHLQVSCLFNIYTGLCLGFLSKDSISPKILPNSTLGLM